MSDTSVLEAVADGGEPTGDVHPGTGGRPVAVYDRSPPSTAISVADTIDSREDAHYCDEWELFSDTQSDASDNADSAFNLDDEAVGQVGSNCQQTTTELDFEPAAPLKGCEQADTVWQEDAMAMCHEVETAPRNSDNICSAISEVHMPASQSEEGTGASLHRRIQVVVRVRPPSDSEGKVVVTVGEKEGVSLCVQASIAQGSISTVTECTFDRVFMGAATQEDVFAAIEPSVQACLEGYNATVFAYGQTGTGKTHTLFGRDLGSPRYNGADEGAAIQSESESFQLVKSSWGIVPRTLSYLLDRAAILKDKHCQVELHLSFLQIYNDRLFDLLTDRMRQKPLLIREQPTLEGTTSVTVQGLSIERITSFSNAMQIIHQGHTNRCVRETESNLSSSRSHAIVQIHVTTQCTATDSDGQVLRRARLNLVDLAGSEKWNTDVEMEDAHSQELKNINTSLSALGNCIAALTEAGRKHIPYRDSTLTRVLQDSFGGNTQSCLIATVNATQQSCDETIRTLHFADRARSVMQTIRVNEVTDGSTELLMAKIQIVKLRERLESEQRRRHETRLKEHQALQRDFQEKLKGKEKEIKKLSRDNAVFQRWREEDVKKIRTLESRVKDLEQQADSNSTKSCDPPKDLATSTPVQGSKRHNTIPMSNSFATRQNVMQKTRSRSNLTRVGSDNGTAARTYKQVLERYALGSSKGQPQKSVTTRKAVLDQTRLTDPSDDGTNQLEESVETQSLDRSLSTNAAHRWEATGERNQADESPDLGRLEATWHQASGLCVSPVTCPQNRNDTAEIHYEDSWKYSNLAAISKSLSHEWALSKSTSALLAQTHERKEHRDEPWSPSPASGCTTAASKQEPATLFKNASVGSFNYAPLPRAQEACEKHKLAGCMLCSVNEGMRQTEPAVLRQSASVAVAFKTTEVNRRPQDGPCDRHQLLRCFICTKSSASNPPASAAQLASASSTVKTNAASTFAYGSAAISSSSAKAANYQTPVSQTESASQSKCALHSLANCILCAGVKAMTRKVVVPSPQASPSKTVSAFDTRSGNFVDDRAAERYRRYTLDERILQQPKLANQW